MARTGTRSRLAALVAVGLLVAACGGGGRDNDAPEASGGARAAGVIDTERCESYEEAPGITDTEIKLGSSFPQSGLFAVFAEISKGYNAYFAYNAAEEGGIDGRTVTVVTKEDAYDPSTTRANVEELVEQDKVFALFNVVGTPNNLAFWDDTDAQCVPNLFVATGAPQWGDAEGHPWTIGSIPSYPTEAAVLADYLRNETDAESVAILSQNDDFGAAYVEAFEKAAGDDFEIVARETYQSTDPSVDPQVTSLAATDADVFLGAVTGLPCPRALDALERSGWDPIVYISQTCATRQLLNIAQPGASNGILTAAYLKDPADPVWDADPAMQRYKEKAAQYGVADIDLNDALTAYGWTLGELLVKTLQQADDLTRLDVMVAARSLDGVEAGLVYDGVTFTTGNRDGFPVESLQILRYRSEADSFERVGKGGSVLAGTEVDLVDFEGETGRFTG